MRQVTSGEMQLFKVGVQTRSGTYAQYDGEMEVWSDGEDVFADAVRKLKRGAFPDYPSSFWRMTRCELVSN
jgi:head-tail adaptor